MGSFDKSKDKLVKSETLEFEGMKITVSIHSYDGGDNKMGLSKLLVKEGEEDKFAKVGRMTKEQAEKVVPVMQKMLEDM